LLIVNFYLTLLLIVYFYLTLLLIVYFYLTLLLQSIERLHSNSSMFESVGGKHDRPHSSASRDDDRASSRDNHSQSARRYVKLWILD